MPVAPTFPGVYIEEIPSGVHTVTGVGTSTTAFIGYTARGPVDEAIRIFSFADFERAFGGLAFDSPVSHAVKHFFQNGGSDAYVVRTASGAAAASVTLRSSAGTPVLNVSARTAGTWGNGLQVDVDYDTLNPRSLFNVRVTEFVDQNGTMVPGRVEVFRNLTHNPADSNYVLNTINANSQLITVTVPALAGFGTGNSQTGTLALADISLLDASHNRFGLSINGGIPFEVKLTPPIPGTLAAALATIAGQINSEITANGGGATATSGADTITITTTASAIGASVRAFNAGTNNAAAILNFGLANGGTEIDAAAAFRPQQTGTAGTPTAALAGANGGIRIEVMRGASATVLKTIDVPIWGPGLGPLPASLDAAATALNESLLTKWATEALLAGSTAQRIGPMIRVLPGTADPNVSFNIIIIPGDTTAASLGFTAAGTRNVARYAPGIGLTALQQVSGAAGNNGVPPGAAQLTGNEAAKTGIYALENVDLFNLLVIPEATAGAGLTSVLTEAIAYCVRRRAFMIMDAPETVTTFAQAQTWIGGAAASFRSRNVALYYPRLRAPNPLKNNIVETFPAAGAIAGIYARTDAERGVWKAPAGTSANVVGATGLSYTLTDKENGALNPLGLNCLRTFPVYGTVSWGARTARGADALADEYKYVPVRRLALFLEESLYRGTQWAVFEPNDEPLWAQIRLNLGAFMHVLFAQGAFQGRTPRDAYFVKCDKETTTQNDINLGRVNIVVGFAPLKPAEFVIIQIQQIAGAIQT